MKNYTDRDNNSNIEGYEYGEDWIRVYFKDNLRHQIKKDFNLELSSKKHELEDELLARRNIKDAVKLIIKKVKDGHLLLKHNYEYGFTRNLWSASIIGLIGSIILLVISLSDMNGTLLSLAITLGIFYLLYLIFGHFVIKYVGKLYAKKLIEEYYEN